MGLWGYFKQPWNVYDWVNIALFWGVLGMRVHVRGEMRDLADLAPFDPSTHLSLQTVTDAKLIEANLMAINAILVYFKVFKYLNRVPFMNTLFATLGKASKQLFYFNIVFFIVMFASCSSFYIGFSTDVYDYRSLGASMISLIRFILGDTDIRELVYHNAYLASFLSFSFVLLVFAILVNMFLAIVNDAYSQVRKEKREYAVFVVLIEQLASNTRFVRWLAGAVRTRPQDPRGAGSEAARVAEARLGRRGGGLPRATDAEARGVGGGADCRREEDQGRRPQDVTGRRRGRPRLGGGGGSVAVVAPPPRRPALRPGGGRRDDARHAAAEEHVPPADGFAAVDARDGRTRRPRHPAPKDREWRHRRRVGREGDHFDATTGVSS